MKLIYKKNGNFTSGEYRFEEAGKAYTVKKSAGERLLKSFPSWFEEVVGDKKEEPEQTTITKKEVKKRSPGRPKKQEVKKKDS